MKRIVSAASMACALLAGPIANATDFELVSLRGDGTPPTVYTDGSNQPAITPDGRYVVFVADATNLVSPSVSGLQVYLHDRTTGTTELVSVGTAGAGGNSSSSVPTISDDGCRVVFTSYASNLVAGDTNGLQDVFVRNRCTAPATTALVSASPGGTPGNGASIDGRISADGTRVVFVTDATNLAAATGLGFECLVVRNLATATTSAITTTAGACIAARVPDISANGSRVAFWGYYAPGTSNVTNGVWQIYLYDFNAASGARLSIVSSSSAGAPQSQGSEGISTVSAPAISADGGYVAFASRGAGLVAVPGGGNYHVYVKDLGAGTLSRASVNSAGTAGNADSSGGGSGYRPGLSSFAETVTFLTSATNLASETGGFFPNVVGHNPYTGTTIGFTAAKTLNGIPAITAGGELIVANSLYALDPAYSSRGMFVFPGLVSRLGNISTRMQVLTGNDVMIGGFVIGGSASKTVAIVATGPSLAAFGITNPLANPTLTLVRSSDQTVIATNDNWSTAANAAQLQAAGFAPSNALESAILVTLPPGAYTGIVSGVGGGTGVAVVAVYEVDSPEVPLVNISTRGQVLTGNDVMIGGFIIQGTDPQTVAIVATGPSLAAFGITNPLANPTLTLVRSSDQSVVATNDNWGTAPNAAQLQAAGFAPSNALEAAILITLQPGAYTAIVSGVGGGTGVGVIAVYTTP